MGSLTVPGTQNTHSHCRHCSYTLTHTNTKLPYVTHCFHLHHLQHYEFYPHHLPWNRAVRSSGPVCRWQGCQELECLHRGDEGEDHKVQDLPGQPAEGEEGDDYPGRVLWERGGLRDADRGDGEHPCLQPHLLRLLRQDAEARPEDSLAEKEGTGLLRLDHRGGELDDPDQG